MLIENEFVRLAIDLSDLKAELNLRPLNEVVHSRRADLRCFRHTVAVYMPSSSKASIGMFPSFLGKKERGRYR